MAKIYSVGEINNYIKGLLNREALLNRLSVTGELSNVKYHSSGHIYFTLKDSRGTIRCVMFAGNRSRGLQFRMQDGQSVVVSGRIDVYERDGTYQMYASQIVLSGVGALYERYEQLKKKLNEEGIFDFEHKKPIPPYASKVGIVTAGTGAAIKDIMSIAESRNPYVQLYLYPAKVQGEGAAESVAKGIKVLDDMGLDTIIIGRGGGSIEDLWAFNEEVVAYAIYNAKTPIISGTGHETDTTIADYAADKRAETPSAACAMAVFSWNDYIEMLNQKLGLLKRAMGHKYIDIKNQIEKYELRLQQTSPQRRLENQQQYLDQLNTKLNTLMMAMLSDRGNSLKLAKERMKGIIHDRYQRVKHMLELKTVRLNGLSPTAKLVKGFGYIEKDGQPVADVEQLSTGDVIKITMKQGSRNAEILE